MALINRCRVMTDYLINIGRKDSYKAKFEALSKAVDEAPAVDAVPVVHARWVKHPPFPAKMEEFHAKGIGLPMGVNSIYWTCSECGTWGTPINNYCPNCGARMDGGSDHA